MSKDLSSMVCAYAADNHLFSLPCHVLVGVSGGADSMALLHLMTHWPSEGLSVSAIHVHHGLRGEAADRDEQHVRTYCDAHNIPLTLIREDVAAIARNEHLTLEEAGRRIRYAHFESVRNQVGADYVLTAHTASDQIETMLMHMIRGCGLDGLTGIPVMRGCIRRPLLCCSREMVEEYCAANHIPYIVDESNADTRFTRNYIRHRILPLMREVNPSVDRGLLRMRNQMDAEAEYLRAVAQTALAEAVRDEGYDKAVMAQQPSVIRRRMIRMLLNEAHVPSFEEIHIVAAEQAIVKGNSRVSLPDGWVFDVGQDLVFLYSETQKLECREQEILEFPIEIVFGNRLVRIRCVDADRQDDENVHSLLLKSAVDYDKIEGKLFLRSRLTDDYMHPSDRGVGKSLKKLMNEWRIPVHLRDAYPLLSDDNGVILVPQYSCDERVRISDDTRRYLVCELLDTLG